MIDGHGPQTLVICGASVDQTRDNKVISKVKARGLIMCQYI
jgi:triosephosphate isomerase